MSILLSLITDQKQGPYSCSLLLLLDFAEPRCSGKIYWMSERFLFWGWGYVCSLGENEEVFCNTSSLNRLNCHWLPHPFLFSQDNCFKNPGICHVLLYLPVLRPTLGTMMFWNWRMGGVQRELQLWWQVNAVWDPALLLTSWDHSNVTWQPESQFYTFF